MIEFPCHDAVRHPPTKLEVFMLSGMERCKQNNKCISITLCFVCA